MTKRLLTALLTTAFVPGALAGQSILAQAGLGVPSDPLDARSRALGVVGVGLTGWGIFPTDPAAAAGLRLPTVVGSFQPATSSVDGQGGSAGHTRFPVVGVAYPFGANVLTATFGSYLDPRWEARTPILLDLAGQEVSGEDVYRSEGGIAQVRVGWARRLSEAWAIGISGGQYTGSIERTFTRTLDPEAVGSEVNPFVSRARWSASGSVVSGGVAWSPSTLVRVGAAASWSGGLELAPEEGTEGPTRSYDLPVEYRVGATFGLSSDLSLSVGAAYADWTEMDDDLSEGGTRGEVWTWGAGAEWGASELLGRPLPIRLGYRRAQLPFLHDGAEASERAVTGGFGFHLADLEDVPMARLEIGFQRGTREAGSFSEDFWRTTVSIRLSGG